MGKMLYKSTSQCLALCALLFISSRGLSGPFDFGGSIERQLDGSVLKSESSIDLTPVRKLSTNSFGLNSIIGSADSLRTLLEDKGLHPYLGMKRIRQLNNGGLGLTGTGNSSAVASDYQFQIGNYPVCGVTLRTIEHGNGSLVVVGNIPLVDQVSSFADSDWPDRTESARFAIEGISAHQGLATSGARITASKRCLMNEQGTLEPVWDFIVDLEGFQFTAWSTPWRIGHASPRFLDASATVRAYDPNKVTGTLKDFTITVTGDTTLTNDFFTTSDYTGAARATSATNSFVYSGTSDAYFAEASTFAYVNQQYDFVAGKGYTWQGVKPLTVIVHALIKGSPNNALYTPSDGSSTPVIRVGDGDGSTLQNLPYDSDVVSHEFGHHVVYQSITTIGGESLVLHEGLADFLAMSRTGDTCLGESICPTGSSLCQVAGKCLRSADNTLAYNDAKYSSYATTPHLQGQLASGFLWDIRKNNGMPGDTLASYVLEAIPYLPSNADFKSLIAALLYVDQLHSNTYQSVIISAATARNLSPSSLGIDLTNLQTSIKSSSPAASSNESSSSKSGGFLGCGTIGSGLGTQQGSAVWMVLILFALPLILRMRPKLQPIPLPVKSKRR